MNKHNIQLLVLLFVLFMSSCKKDLDPCPKCPRLSSITPNSAHHGDTVLIVGKNLMPDYDLGDKLEVNFNGSIIPANRILFHNADTIKLIIPKATPSGPVVVDLNKDDGLIGDQAVPFTYLYKYVVSTLAGEGNHGYMDSSDPLQAKFNTILDVAVNPSTNDVYVLETDHIRKIAYNGGVSTILSATTGYESALGCGLQEGAFICFRPDSCKISYLVDEDGIFSLQNFAGTPQNCGDVSSSLANSSFSQLNDLVVDESNNMFLADFNYIKKISSAGMVTKIAGGGQGFNDGNASDALFMGITSLDYDQNGDIYIADIGNHRIRKLSGNTVSTVAGNGLNAYLEGNTAIALLSKPYGIACDNFGGVYFTEGGHYAVRKIDINTSTVSLFAGGHHAAGTEDGEVTLARFNNPTKLAMNKNLNILYVVDSMNYKIRQIKIE